MSPVVALLVNLNKDRGTVTQTDGETRDDDTL